MFICTHVPTEESRNSNVARIENTLNLNWARLCVFGAFRKERNSLDQVGTKTGSDQLEFLHTSDAMMVCLVELCGVFTTRVCTVQLLNTFDLRQNERHSSRG